MTAERMLLLMAVVQEADASGLIDALIDAGYPGPTRIASTGGFLREANVTLLFGVECSKISQVIHVLANHCHTRSRYIHPLPPIVDATKLVGAYPLEVQVGGAAIFILDVERFEHW